MAERVALTSALEGEVVDVDLTQSGISSTSTSTMKFYDRAQFIRLWDFLEGKNERFHIVEVAPCVGKSVEVFHHAMWYAWAKRKRVRVSTYIQIT